MDLEECGFSRAVYLIIVVEFLARFSVSGLRSTLTLYLESGLLLPEQISVTVYHVFVMLSCVAPLLGACVAGGALGKYRTILFFSCVYIVGKVLLCAAVSMVDKRNAMVLTAAGLLLASVGLGARKPCSATFLGDQLRAYLPLAHVTKDLGAVLGALLTPALRQAVPCLGSRDCYLLALGATTLVFCAAHLLFLLGKPLYKLKHPRQNVIPLFITCASYALWQKLRARRTRNRHWLDHAYGKYDPKLIEDMKVVFSIMLIFTPLPIFWSLFDQQGSQWIFQASRMDRRVLGFTLMPDQVQAINPAMVMVLTLALHGTVLPRVHTHGLPACLWGMVVGGLLAGLAFIAAGLVELHLQVSYSSLPDKGEAFLNVINQLPCKVIVSSPFSRLRTVDRLSNHVFRHVPTLAPGRGGVVVVAIAGECVGAAPNTSWAPRGVPVEERQVSTLVVLEDAGEMDSYVLEPDAVQVCGSRNPLLRMVFLTRAEDRTLRVSLTSAMSSYSERSDPRRRHSHSGYTQLSAGRYAYEVELLSDEERLAVSGTLMLQVGQVYTLVLQEYNSNISVHLYGIPPVAATNVLWLLPQYTLISVAEVLFVSAGVQFVATQAPCSMRTATLALWYLSVAVGNFVIIAIANCHLSVSQAHDFFFFAGLSFVGLVFFALMAAKYRRFVEARTSSSEYAFRHHDARKVSCQMATSDFSMM